MIFVSEQVHWHIGPAGACVLEQLELRLGQQADVVAAVAEVVLVGTVAVHCAVVVAAA